MFREGWAPPPTDAVLNHISQEFTFTDLQEATSNFSSSSRLGEGTYGTVFRGTLRDGTEVAIKALASPKEGGFREEVEVLSRFRHPNLVILLGFARNGRERYLVYELLPGGDLNSRLGKDAEFTWRHRTNVALDAALGLSHLHCSRPQVFHRDVKTQNILMDRNGTGKVADFGLACLAQPNQKSLAVAQTSGTIGYADPLYIRSGVVTEKSEVYSLGMVLLEVLTGRPPALQHASGRIDYQFEHLHGDLMRLFPMVDPRGQWPQIMIERVGGLALRCIHESEAARPNFVEIVTQLRAWLRDESLTQAAQAQPQAQPPVHQAQRQQFARGHEGFVAGRAGVGGVAPVGAQGQGANPWDRQPYAANPVQAPWPPVAGATPDRLQPMAAAGQQQGGAQLRHHQMAGAQRQQAQVVQAHGVRANVAGMQGAVASAAAPNQAAEHPPPTASPGREEDIKQVMDFGFTKHQATEAFKRCSTVEAAVTWIVEREWPPEN